MSYIGNSPSQTAFLTDQFSGTGSQTAFTMSVAPANTASCIVAVSGVLQDPTTYSVVGTTLNFTVAPPVGSGNISVRYLGIPASGVTTTAYRTVTEFTATASQTTFTPPSYTVGFLNVYRNGVLLGSADYTATNGTTVVLATGATSGDLITTESFLVSSVLNAIPNTTGSISSSNLPAGLTINTPTIASPTITSPTISTSASLPANTTLNSLNLTPYTMKNRIINGAMVIDQRNAGASVTQSTSVAYTVDRWSCYGSVASKFTVQRNAGSVTPPVGFTNYLGITSSSAYTVGASEFFFVQQVIEGYNVADLGFGSASASSVTISFWVRSSLTGTFGGTLSNGATNRVYPFTYTISSANTWEQKTVTIAGDTTGTWTTDNTGGLVVNFNMGAGASVSGSAGAWSGSTLRAPTGATSVVGTNGATWYITGVQLEVGSYATPFEWRLFNQELTNCQRYYIQSYPYGTVAGTNIGASGAGTLEGVNYGATSFGYTIMGPFSFPVTMRTNASVTIYNNITGSSTASTCIRNVNASTNVAGYVLSSSDKQVYISCDAAPVTIRAECAITASAEL